MMADIFKKFSLRFKLIACVALFVFLLIGVIGGILTRSYFVDEKKKLDNALSQELSIVAYATSAGLEFNDVKTVESSIGLLKNIREFTEVKVIDKDGRVFFTKDFQRGGDSAAELFSVKAPIINQANAQIGTVEATATGSHFKKEVQDAVWMALLLIVVVTLLGVFMAAFIIDSIIRKPLSAMIGRLKDIAEGEGDLTKRMDESGRDEIAEVAKWFNVFVEKIRGIIVQVKKGALSIDTSGSQIRTATQEQVTGATEQASAVNEASTTVKELAVTASQIASNAENVAKVAERTMAGMQEINIRVDSTAKKILALGEKSQAIGNITKLIDGIADQTNLLALNAAIEAARAGEAGRGFAVVAMEVRKLAERSSESTEEIRQLITEIQSETNATVMGIEDSLKWVARGVEMIRETAGSAKEISIATQQQRTASDQTVQAMQNINAVTKQFAASTKQAATSATALGDLARQLKFSIEGFKLS
ncbi:MAG: HAMP domain-containing protein [Candidatus Omnitrophica bacterium]|nr:HAMP domain-containing protein [Candidatus Omnitrophota bacterium]